MMLREEILGYPVAAVSGDDCLQQIVDWLAAGDRRRYFACANPHSLVTAETDPEFRQALLDSDLLVPDGVGILLASRIHGGQIRQRVTGSDIFIGLSQALNRSTKDHYSYFFLGASEATLQEIEGKMALDFPNIRFAGAYSPPFKAVFSVDDSRKMVEAINAARPNVLWVGMTAPKQEKWVHQHRGQLDFGFAGAVGAVFDFYTGRVKRSPLIFQRLGLEWLPRLLQEPRRLWRRNLLSNPVFVLKVLREKILTRK